MTYGRAVKQERRDWQCGRERTMKSFLALKCRKTAVNMLAMDANLLCRDSRKHFNLQSSHNVLHLDSVFGCAEFFFHLKLPSLAIIEKAVMNDASSLWHFCSPLRLGMWIFHDVWAHTSNRAVWQRGGGERNVNNIAALLSSLFFVAAGPWRKAHRWYQTRFIPSL